MQNAQLTDVSQHALQLASDIATYSASVDDRATVVCFLELHIIAPPPDMNTYLEIDFQSSAPANAVSEYPWKGSSLVC
jgi:hypothetical protein